MPALPSGGRVRLEILQLGVKAEMEEIRFFPCKTGAGNSALLSRSSSDRLAPLV